MIQLPITYEDGSLLTLMYRIDPSVAAAVVPPAFEPMTVLGKALVIVAAFDYRQSTIGPYGELGVGVQVKRKGSSPSVLKWARDPRQQDEQGIWVCSLPVTTETARTAGIEVWGYPKYLCEMESSFTRKGVRFRLGDELRIEMGRGPGIGLKGLPFVTLTERGGTYVRSVVETNHRVKHGGASTVRIERLGDGPTTQAMDMLGLFAARPWAAQRTDALRAALGAGVDLGPARELRLAA